MPQAVHQISLVQSAERLFVHHANAALVLWLLSPNKHFVSNHRHSLLATGAETKRRHKRRSVYPAPGSGSVGERENCPLAALCYGPPSFADDDRTGALDARRVGPYREIHFAGEVA